MRKFAHPDYYPEVLTSGEHAFTPGHFGENRYPFLLDLFSLLLTATDHCIENLRRAVMCHADVGLFSVEWVGDSSQGIEGKRLRSNADSLCVDWDAIDKWARKRALEKGNFYLLPGPFEHLDHGDHD